MSPPTWDFPTTPGAYDRTTGNLFVSKLDATGGTLEYSTLIGPASQTTTRSKIAVDGGGNAYITGDGAQSSYPTSPGPSSPPTRPRPPTT